MNIYFRRNSSRGLALAAIAVLAACDTAPTTVVCWEEPALPVRGGVSHAGAIQADKYHVPSAMRTVCAPVSVRLPTPPNVQTGTQPSPGRPLPPAPGPAQPSNPPGGAPGVPKGGAQTSPTPIAWGEPVNGQTPMAATLPDGGVVVGTLEDLKTGDDIREALSGLGNQIWQQVENDVR